jgi:HD superfamily phosphodiesterase
MLKQEANMATVHDFNAAFDARQDLRVRAQAHVLHISQAVDSMLQLAKREETALPPVSDIDAIGALIADWAAQLALLCDGEQRLQSQYIRRLAQMVREQARSIDPLRVEALAVAMRLQTDRLAEQIASR